MPKEKLTKLVDELSEELKGAHDLDDADKNLLQATVDNINDLLDSTDGNHEEALSAMEKLEVDHPVIMGIVKKMMDALSNMGV